MTCSGSIEQSEERARVRRPPLEGRADRPARRPAPGGVRCSRRSRAGPGGGSPGPPAARLARAGRPRPPARHAPGCASLRAVARAPSRPIRRKPLLRARDRQGDAATRRSHRPRRRPDPREPARARARQARASASACPRGDGDRRGAVAAHRGADRRGPGQRRLGSCDRGGCGGRHRRTGRRPRAVRTPAARLDHLRPDPAGPAARSCTRGWPRSSKTPRSGAVTSHWPPITPMPRSPRRSTRPPRRARARGAPGSAAELWEQARRLTPANAGGEARRRGLEAAERRFDAGEVDRARALLEEVVAESPPGWERARSLTRLGWVSAHAEGFHAAEEVFRGCAGRTCR